MYIYVCTVLYARPQATGLKEYHIITWEEGGARELRSREEERDNKQTKLI